MRLELKNVGRNHKNWDSIVLMSTDGNLCSLAKYEILETDQISFKVNVPSKYISAKLIIENIELQGAECCSDDDLVSSFEWLPKHNKKFGYDAIFLHFFGIAQLAVELTNINNETNVVLFEPINIYGRLVTADRAVSMLSYISKEANHSILKALSPTTFGSKLVKNGISPADILKRLEKTLEEIEPIVKTIIHRPITSLRGKTEILYNPTPDQVDDESIEWISENSGLSVDALCSDDGLFQFGMHWRSMPEVKAKHLSQSCDLYENQLIAFYLSKVSCEGRRIVERCEQYRQNLSFTEERDFGGEYRNFYNVTRKSLQAVTAKYLYRAKLCMEKSERMLLVFNRMVPTSKNPLGKVALTEKLKANRHYLLLIKHLKEWLEIREINWIEQNILSSVNSTPVLFEYYTVLLTNRWLKNNGETSQQGLFDGTINGRKARLYYEPSYPHPSYGDSKYGIWSSDISAKKGRRPDIVIDLSYEENTERELVILDAKCRKEQNVLRESLPECIPKYGYGIRDKQGNNPVKCVVMLHPKPNNETDSFVDFYAAPYNCFGLKRAYPILGAQRMNIDSKGSENGFHRLLHLLILDS